MNSVELYRQRDSWQVDTRKQACTLAATERTLQHGKRDASFGFNVVHYEYLWRDTFLKCIINGFIGVNAVKQLLVRKVNILLNHGNTKEKFVLNLKNNSLPLP